MKADYGYMLVVRKPVSSAQIEDWANQISGINVKARESAVEKLDASFIALTRAAEASERQKVADPSADVPAAHTTLHDLIDAYFAAVEDPSAVVAGSGEERRRLLSSALGAEYHTSVAMQARPILRVPAERKRPEPAAPAGSGSSQLRGVAVVAAVTRLLLDPAWPQLPCEELDAMVPWLSCGWLLGR